MTTGDVGRGLGSGGLGAQRIGPVLSRAEPALDIEAALAEVDRILAEPGRRRHLFGWLKVPGGGSEDWLPVAAYYPANRLVVVWHDAAAEHVAVFRELVPAHGLRLLEVRPAELSAGRQAVRELLESRIAGLGLPPPQAARAVVTQGVANASAGAREARRPKPRSNSEVAGVLAGLALAAALILEVYFGVARFGFGTGNLLLAFGLAFDACSRALGAVAAWRAGESEWAWWCALGGSPLAAGFAFMQDSGPVKTEPAPLAGTLGLAAIALLVLAVLVGAFGG